VPAASSADTGGRWFCGVEGPQMTRCPRPSVPVGAGRAGAGGDTEGPASRPSG
jgi:hypothetical protein